MPQNLDQQVSKLHISITTGDDDVRSQSNVYGIAVILQGQQINSFSKSLNDGANWKNGSTHDADLEIAQVRVRDIQAFRIVFSSGQPDPFATQDNWNMDRIIITYKLDDGTDDILLEQADTPVHRFTGSSPQWEMYFHWV